MKIKIADWKVDLAALKARIIVNKAAYVAIDDNLDVKFPASLTNSWAASIIEMDNTDIESDYYTVMATTEVDTGEPFFAEFCVDNGEKFEVWGRFIVDGELLGNVQRMGVSYTDDSANQVVLVTD